MQLRRRAETQERRQRSHECSQNPPVQAWSEPEVANWTCRPQHIEMTGSRGSYEAQEEGENEGVQAPGKENPFR